MKRFCILIMMMVGCLGFLTAQTYRVGDVYTAPDGSQGIVFYLFPNGTGGWVVALEDASENCSWGDETDVPGLVDQNPQQYQNLLYDTAGYASTQAIRNYQNNSTYAAGVVDFGNGWYLPSPAQLRMLHAKMPLLASAVAAAGGVDMAKALYWCSAEQNSHAAWQVDFGKQVYHGRFLPANKTDSAHVRAVRSFTYEPTYLWSTGDTTATVSVVPWHATEYTVTVTNPLGCSGIASKTIEMRDPAAFLCDTVFLCADSSTTLTARAANSYLWSTGDTTQSVTVSVADFYTVTVTPADGCQMVDTFKVTAVKVNGIYNISIPDICAGDSYTVKLGHGSDCNVTFIGHETVLALHDTVFLPDGRPCGDPPSCSYRSPLNFAGYEDTAKVNNVNDIRYVRLNLEHSWSHDLYINLTCPNEQKADILKMGNDYVHSFCVSSIPASSRGWAGPDSINALGYTFFGLANDAWNRDTAFTCVSSDPENAPGIGWNYCWSNNTAENYQYAPGDGLIYRAENVSVQNEYYDVFDSSDVVTGTKFYHPDESFENLIGCPLNGSWYIEVMDGGRGDNGYIFGWELALAPNIHAVEYSDVVRTVVEGPWVTATSDSSFLFEPPADLERDTVISYLFHCFNEYGCGFDTVVDIAFFARSSSAKDSIVCENFTWKGITYYESGVFYDTLANVHGCDSIASVHFTIAEPLTHIVTGPASFCAGDSAELTACDAVTYLWNTGDTTQTIIVSDSGYFSVSVADIHGCVYDTMVHVSMIPLTYTYLDTVECEQLEWMDTIFNKSGVHRFTFPGSNGCDSIVVLNLVIPENPIVEAFLLPMAVGDTQPVSIGTQTGYNLQYLSPQTIVDTTSTHHYVTIANNDLDGLWVSRLTDSTFVITPPYDLANDTVATYMFTLTDVYGCTYDTTVEVPFYANRYTELYDTVGVSELDLVWNGVVFSGPGSDTVVLQTVHGADSIITMHLSVIYSYDTTVCEDDLPLEWLGRTFEQAGTWSSSYPVDGADSIEVITLNAVPLSYDTLRIGVVENDIPYWLNGVQYDSSDTYTQILVNSAGCDSVLTIVLTVYENVHQTIDSTICSNELPFEWNGVTFERADTLVATLSTSSGADSVLLMQLSVLQAPEANISGPTTICNGETAVLTADGVGTYLWNTGDTTSSITVGDLSLYTVTVTNDLGCSDVASFQILHLITVYPIDTVHLTDMCAGNVYPISVGHRNESSIVISNPVTTLSWADTVFLPDGTYCEPYGCSYRSPLIFTDFAEDAVVNSVNDILYVRLNMEHSYAADLYINITCPNNQKADILKFDGFANSECNSSIPLSSRHWQPGNNAGNSTFFGMAYDYNVSDCDASLSDNAPGIGWNYCWSNNTISGYIYAPGEGSLVYRYDNAHYYTDAYSESHQVRIFDSSNVANGTQFYHPDQSFASLIGCPLNGPWYIEVMDGYNVDNGYLFGWGLALAPHLVPGENTDVSLVTVDGPWVTTVTDTTFIFSPPVDLTHDTVVSYTFHFFDENGCSYDTTVVLNVFAQSHMIIDTFACDSFTWSGTLYTESGQYIDTLTNQHGCDSTVTLNLTIYHTPEVSIGGPSWICQDSAIVLIVDSCATYLWSTGDTTRTIVVMGAGTYSVTVSEEHGCSTTVTHTVSSPVNPIVSVGEPGMCADDTFIVSVGTAPSSTVVLNQNPTLFLVEVQGLWLSEGGQSATTITPPVGLPSDTAVVYAVSISDTNGCHFDTTITLTVYALPQSSFDTVVCDSFQYADSVYTQSGSYVRHFASVHGCDSTVTFTLTVNSSVETYDTLYLLQSQLPYYIEPANVTIYNPENSQQQYILATSNNCDSLVHLQVYVYPNVTITFDTTICPSALPLVWHGHTFTGAGTVVDSFQTSVGSDSILTYNVSLDNLAASIGNVTHVVCYGASTGAVTTQVSGGQAPLSYQWLNATGNIVATTAQLNNVPAGFYSFIVADQLGCSATDTVTIRNLNGELVPGTITGDQAVCEGEMLTAFTGTAATGGDNGGYQWQYSEDSETWTAAPGVATTQNYTYPEVPEEPFQLRRAWISATCGTVYSNVVTVSVWPSYQDTLTASVCQGSTYSDNGFEIDETMTEEPGIYFFEQRLTTGHCDSVVVLQLTVNQKYEFSIEDEICEGDGYYANGFSISAEQTIGRDTLVRSLAMQSSQGCDSLVQLHLTIVDTFLRIISLTPDFCEELMEELSVETNMLDYIWNTGDYMPQITVTLPGLYSVTASQGNCSATARYQVNPCEYQIVLPNAISPSKNDGLNDEFAIPEQLLSTIYDFEISVFNRWGELVYYSTDKNFKWNGEVKGKVYYNNVYNYIIRYTNANGKPFVIRGSLTVL